MTSELPLGFVVKLNRKMRVEDNGLALIGGAPTRVLYISEAARSRLCNGTIKVTDQISSELADRLLELGMADPVVAELPEWTESAITFVVPVRDRALSLERLLTSIGAEQKIIVVDDFSRNPQPIAEITKRHGGQLIALTENVGPAGARNAGLEFVNTPYVVFVDSDVRLSSEVVPVLLKHFNDPKVALVAPRISGFVEDGHHNWISRYEDSRSSLDLGRYPATVRPHSPVSWLPSAFIIAKVSALGSGFTPHMRVAEDVDLIWRLAEQGWRIRFEPSVEVKHEHRIKFGDWFSRKVFYGTGADSLAKRHGDKVAPALLAPWSAGVLIALLAQQKWSVPLAILLSLMTALRIARRLPRSKHPLSLSMWLTFSGVVSALGQLVELLLRHWWPLALLGCLFSAQIRYAVIAAATFNIVMEYKHRDTKLDPIRFALLRRLDDVAYGTGLWLGAIRGRSIQALMPKIRRAT